MPLLLVIVGLVLIICGLRNTLGDLMGHLSEDIVGRQPASNAGTSPLPSGVSPGDAVLPDVVATPLGASFPAWVLAIVAIGALGYVPALRTPSRLLMALVVIVIMLANRGGFFAMFVEQLRNLPAPTAARPVVPDNLGAPPIQLLGGSGGSAGSSGAGGSGVSGAAVGTAAGAAIGSIVPGVGTVIGGMVGGLAGGLADSAGGSGGSGMFG